MANTKLISWFFLWRQKYLSHRQFIYMVSCLVGVLSGLTAVVLKNGVHKVHHFLTHLAQEHANVLIFLFPVIGLILTVLFVKYLIKEPIGHGVSKILFAISRKNGKLASHHTYSSLIGSTLTVGFGGSVGLEAPIVLTGSAIGSNLGRFLRLNYKSVIVLIGCGAAGAIAGIFKAPVAAVVFGLEVLMLDLTMWSLIPLLISAVSGALVAYFFMGDEVMFNFALEQTFGLINTPYYLLLGVLSGLLSLYFTRLTNYIEHKVGKINNTFFKPGIGGVLLGALIFLLPPLYGEGYNTLNALLNDRIYELSDGSIFGEMHHNTMILLLFLAAVLLTKVVASSLTNGSGGVGGIFAPTLFMGGIIGYSLALFVNFTGIASLPLANFTLAGMAGVMAGVMHAPLTAIFLIAEITGGYQLFVPLIITATISFMTISYFEPHSLYTKRLAERGELITHHKDKAILTLLRLEKIIEKDLKTIQPNATLAGLVKVVASSKRNIYPVVDEENTLVGIVLLDDVRHIIFNDELHHSVHVRDVMILPPAFVSSNDPMESVIKKFEDTGAWNLPVIDKGKYVGFISKSKLFSVYRKWLVDMSDE
ncbi:MAG: CBS domain-containing protein [Bacteroidetes bacterium]|jgi:CIC family chloride channel protein|nr:CBS domain-containing protein [Bacteroidota bacterium]